PPPCAHDNGHSKHEKAKRELHGCGAAMRGQIQLMQLSRFQAGAVDPKVVLSANRRRGFRLYEVRDSGTVARDILHMGIARTGQTLQVRVISAPPIRRAAADPTRPPSRSFNESNTRPKAQITLAMAHPVSRIAAPICAAFACAVFLVAATASAR